MSSKAGGELLSEVRGLVFDDKVAPSTVAKVAKENQNGKVHDPKRQGQRSRAVLILILRRHADRY